MNIVDRAKAFVHALETLAKRTAWDWRACPKCGKDDTIKYGSYTTHPWFLDGRHEVVIQRHKCNLCSGSAVGGGKTFTYSEQSPYLVRGSWYAREVHRYSIDLWQHGRSSVRRASEFVRSLLGRQERWLLWRLFEPEPEEARKCHFSPSTLDRWLDRAGEVAKGRRVRLIDETWKGGISCGRGFMVKYSVKVAFILPHHPQSLGIFHN